MSTAPDPFGADPPLPPEMALDAPPIDVDVVVDELLTWVDDDGDEETFAAQAVDAIIAGDEGTEGRWRIVSDDQAEWAMAKLAEAERHIQEAKARLDAYRDRLARWHRREVRRSRATRGFMAAQLCSYALQRRDATGAATLNLPSGVVRTQATRKPRIDVVDPEALLEWARSTLSADHWEQVVEVVERVRSIELSKIVQVAEQSDGTLVVIYEGSPVAGLTATWPPPTAKATPNIGARP